ncbi:MAG: hypothetical protein DWQ02_24420 [Bacteroidetes bacterium]|nr:MAG: hypothetical protein DWQ02_24420 [Bacteroidota bacterium]
MNRLVSEELINALGWTVLHSLWQALLVALVVAGGTILLQKRGAQWRYRLANAGLLAVVILACYTFFKTYTGIVEAEILELTNGGAIAIAPLVEESSFWHIFETYFNNHMPLIVVIWFMGMVVFLLRMLGGLAYVEYLKNRFTKELPENWQGLMEQLSNKLSLKRKVRLLESALVTVPMVVGWVKPVILIPVGAVNGLTMEQVEAVLAHELAHISRNDFIWNLLQSLVEVMFYFNPAVWWISAVIRNERENCCDDIALELCDDRLAYAKALVEIQEQNRNRKPGLALAFSSRRRQLLNRISRILNHPQNKSKIMEKFVITSLLLLAVLGISMSEYRGTEDIEADEDLPLLELVSEADHNQNVAKWSTSEIHQDGFVAADTLPQGKNRLIVEREDQKMVVEIEDGEIKSLKVDGEEIPEEDFDKYTLEVEELWSIEPDNDNSFFWVSPSEGNTFHFRSQDGEEFFFDQDFNIEIPEFEFDNQFYFKNKDGKSIFVLPEYDFNFELPEDFGDEYKEQMEKLKLHLEEYEELNKEQVKELLERQKLIQEELMHQYKDQSRRMHENRIIIEERKRDALREKKRAIERAQRAERDVLRERRAREHESVILGNGIYINDGNDVVVFGSHGRNHSGALVKALMADGLIDKDSDEYKVELSGKKLKVNGKKQPDHIHQKYLELYERLSGFELDEKSKVVIRHNER